MFKRDFYSFRELVDGSGSSEEAIRQALIRGDLRAYIEPRKRIARLRFLSGSEGLAPEPGRDPWRSWDCVARPDRRSKDFYYLLSGWYQVAPESLSEAARSSMFTEPPQVLLPPDHDGLTSDGDVLEFSIEEFGDDGAAWGVAADYMPTMRDLWFDSETIEDLALEIDEKKQQGAPDNGAVNRALESAIVSTAEKIAADNRRSIEGSVQPVLTRSSSGEKPLNTRERNNLLRIIVALAKVARIDISAGGPGAAAIEAAVISAGFDEGPKEKTVRDVLAQARALTEG